MRDDDTDHQVDKTPLPRSARRTRILEVVVAVATNLTTSATTVGRKVTSPRSALSTSKFATFAIDMAISNLNAGPRCKFNVDKQLDNKNSEDKQLSKDK